jgi:hypothetical protein
MIKLCCCQHELNNSKKYILENLFFSPGKKIFNIHATITGATGGLRWWETRMNLSAGTYRPKSCRRIIQKSLHWTSMGTGFLNGICGPLFSEAWPHGLKSMSP